MLVRLTEQWSIDLCSLEMVEIVPEEDQSVHLQLHIASDVYVLAFESRSASEACMEALITLRAKKVQDWPPALRNGSRTLLEEIRRDNL